MYVIELPSFVLIAEGVDCVADKPKLERNILGLGNFKFFGKQWPLVNTVSYSNQTCWLLQLLFSNSLIIHKENLKEINV